MSVHEVKIRTHWLDRVRSGEKRAEVRKHDRDYQVGDFLALIEVTRWDYPVTDYVERDELGRFVRDNVQRPPVMARITHVLDGRQVDGLDSDYCLLSIEVTS